MADMTYEKPIRVRAVDIDQTGRLQPVIALDYLLEAAGEHAVALGAGVPDLIKKGLTWVLSRLHVEFFRYPRWGETARLRTWPSVQQALYALREFDLADGAGPALRATTSWIVLDLKTKRPVRPAEHFQMFPLNPEWAVEDDFAPLPSPARIDLEKRFPVFFSDIDLNRHVTSTVYVQRALETVPDEVLFHRRPASIEVNFRSEAFYGDEIISRTENLSAADETPLRFVHRLSRAADDREFALLHTSWR